MTEKIIKNIQQVTPTFYHIPSHQISFELTQSLQVFTNVSDGIIGGGGGYLLFFNSVGAIFLNFFFIYDRLIVFHLVDIHATNHQNTTLLSQVITTDFIGSQQDFTPQVWLYDMSLYFYTMKYASLIFFLWSIDFWLYVFSHISPFLHPLPCYFYLPS